MDINPLLQSFLVRIVQKLLFAASGVLVTRGVFTGDEMTDYIAAGALAIVGGLWSYLQANRERIKLLFALSSATPMSEARAESEIAAAKASPDASLPAATTPKDVTPRSFMSSTRNYVAVLAIGLSGLVAIGCATSVKQRVVFAYQATETSLGSFQDAERALYAAKSVPQLTDARHRDISAALQKAFSAQQTFGQALLVWRSGQPVPTETQTWFAEIERVLIEVQKLDTGGNLPTELARQVVAWAKAIIDVAGLLKVSPPAIVTTVAAR